VLNYNATQHEQLVFTKDSSKYLEILKGAFQPRRVVNRLLNQIIQNLGVDVTTDLFAEVPLQG